MLHLRLIDDDAQERAEDLIRRRPPGLVVYSRYDYDVLEVWLYHYNSSRQSHREFVKELCA